MKTRTPKVRSASTRTYLFDATGEPPCDYPYRGCVTRWLLDVATRRGVTHRGAHLLALLDTFAKEEGVCWPKAATLSGLMGYRDPYSPALYRELRSLEDAGTIESVRGGERGGRRVRYRLLRPSSFTEPVRNGSEPVRNGRVDPAEAAGKPVRNGRQKPQPNPQTKSSPNPPPGRGASASLGSGRVRKGDTSTELPVSRPADSTVESTPPARAVAVRERLRRLREEREQDSGRPSRRTGDELVEAARMLGFKALGLVKQRLKERGADWLRDLLDAAEQARSPCGFLGTYLKKPDEFDQPSSPRKSTSYDRPEDDDDFGPKPREYGEDNFEVEDEDAPSDEGN